MPRGKIVFTEEQRNFLLSPAAKELKPIQAKRLGADEAYERFKDVRWGWQQGKPYCPHCNHEKLYEHRNRSTFKCARCGRHFSVTTRTVFHSRKMPYSTILQAISLRLHDPKNALQSSYDLGVTYKTSVSLSQRFRTFFGNIIPKTREARWPYADLAAPVTEERRTEGFGLIEAVNKTLPSHLPEQVRSDVAQDIIVGVLSGDISENNLRNEVRDYIRSHYKRVEWRFGTSSLDQPKSGTEGRSWHDYLRSDCQHF